MRRADIVIGLLLLFGSLYLIFDASKMNYLSDGVPGPGFWPIWVAIMICAMALLLLVGSIRSQPKAASKPVFTKEFWRNSAIVIGGSAVAMLLVQFIGMLAGIGILVGFLSWALGTKSYKMNMALLIISPFFFWLVFEKALDVRLPASLLGF